jgi:hypothetical protein
MLKEMKPFRRSCLMGFCMPNLSTVRGLENRGNIRYLDLVDDVKRILIARVREDDAVEGVRQPIWGCPSLKGVLKVGKRLRNARDVAAQYDETREGDEDERQQLDNAYAVGEPVREASVESADCLCQLTPFEGNKQDQRGIPRNATVNPAMATPFNSQSVGTWPLIRNRYCARTTTVSLPSPNPHPPTLPPPFQKK